MRCESVSLCCLFKKNREQIELVVEVRVGIEGWLLVAAGDGVELGLHHRMALDVVQKASVPTVTDDQ
jgi:hypothetical protein